VKDGLSVREVERLAGEDGPQKKRAKTITLNPEISRIENDLKEVLGTRVKIKDKGKKGILEIEYYSKEELERLIDLLKTLQ
jgi:ParB family chromosome partitioning protein